MTHVHISHYIEKLNTHYNIIWVVVCTIYIYETKRKCTTHEFQTHSHHRDSSIYAQSSYIYNYSNKCQSVIWCVMKIFLWWWKTWFYKLQWYEERLCIWEKWRKGTSFQRSSLVQWDPEIKQIWPKFLFINSLEINAWKYDISQKHPTSQT